MKPDKPALRSALDWTELVPLRLRARAVAEGVYAGAHRSFRRGAGVEFGGHRSYVPGDDLRFIDRRALMRHGDLLVRQFETETDRGLFLLLDASASMAYQSDLASCSKFQFATLIAAALARICLMHGDRAGLYWLGGKTTDPVPLSAGRDAFERLVMSLERGLASGDVLPHLSLLETAVGPLLKRPRRGEVVVFLSDLLDLPEGAAQVLAALAVRGRVFVTVQVLDPAEQTLPFEGSVRLRALEGNATVVTDPALTRPAYLSKLRELAAEWREKLLPSGGRLVESGTGEDPVEVVRRVLRAAELAGP